MPRIPVRTEPYTSPTRQHRHFKSKRDLILRTLGKSSYINHSQFLICFLSAKGEIETYASEMLQDSVDEVLDMEALSRLAVQVRERADQKREQLEELQRQRGEDGDEEEIEPAEAASQALRSAKKAKAERVAAEKAHASLAKMEGIDAPVNAGSCGKGKEKARDPPMTPLREVRNADMLLAEQGEEDEGDDEYDEENERATKMQEPPVGLFTGATPATMASVTVDPITEPKKEEPENAADITLVDTPSFPPLNTGESVSLKRKLDATPRTGLVRQVQVTMSGSPLSLRNMPRGSAPNRGMLMSATPARPTLMASEFVTPSIRNVAAPTPNSGRGLMNNVLESASAKKRQPKIMLGHSLVGDGPHIPRPLAHIRTPSHPTVAPTGGTPYTPSVQTRTITIPSRDLIDWYANSFDSLQQTVCKLVVKSWIKVIDPKKASKFPYNRGDDCRPDWWPDHIRHREPDHLQKPERTQILVSLIRSSLVPIAKLELSTAEQTAYIDKPKMKILREIYKVAKEDERRRALGDVTSDIVVNVPVSPPPKADAPRMSILDEIAELIDEAPKSRRLSITKTQESRRLQNLASPCIIVPSALPNGHARIGSIGESVFLGAGAFKKRKLDVPAHDDKENVDPHGKGKVHKAAARQEVATGTIPQSTKVIRKQPQAQRTSLAAPGDSKLVSPLTMAPLLERPQTTTGVRARGGSRTTETPMNHRQRVQQGDSIVRPMSIDSAPPPVGHGVFGNGMPPSNSRMNPHLVSAGMEMYVTADPHFSGPSGVIPMHHDPNHAGPVQYIPYGTPHHGMPPFASVPHQGMFVVYDPPPRLETAGSSDRRHSGRYSLSHPPHPPPHPMQGQAYVYPPFTGYQSMYIPAGNEMHAYPPPREVQPDSQGPMLSYPTGMTLLAEEEPTELAGEERVKRARRQTTGSMAAGDPRNGATLTAHLGMTISLPLALSNSATTINGMQNEASGLSHPVTTEMRVEHCQGIMPDEQTTPPRPILHEADGNPIIPTTVNPSNINPTTSEMENVEREFVKFSDADGSDREGFWEE